jgi:hypothetical protein
MSFFAVILDSSNVGSNIGFCKCIPGLRKWGGYELGVHDSEIGIIEHIQALPVLFQLGKVVYYVVTIWCALWK